MHRWMGAEVTSSVGVKASQFQLTDAGASAPRSRLSLVEPPRSRPAWRSVFGDYKVAAVALAPERRVRPHHLRTHPDRRAASLVLFALCAADRGRARRHHPLRAVLRQRDPRHRPRQKRTASMAMVSELSPQEKDDAVARMQENSLIVQWVQQCLEQRVSAYRWALERLGDPGAGRPGFGRRPPDRRARGPDRQSAWSSRRYAARQSAFAC